MLEKPEQLAAYAALNAAGGLVMPEATVITNNVKKAAGGLQVAFAGMVDSAVKYPDDKIGKEIAFLRSVPASLAGFSPDCDQLVAVITEATSLDHMITLNIGWDIHCKTQNLPSDTPMPAIKAVTDTTATTAALAALESVDCADLSKAMTEINDKLKAGSGGATGGSSAGGAVPPVTLPDQLIQSLKDAVSKVRPAIDKAVATHQPITELHTIGRAALSTSKSAYQSAIAITLLGNVGGGGALKDAAAAIMPDGVKDALFPKPAA